MYVVGIDGGGTKTSACLMSEKGKVLGIGRTSGSSIDTVAPAVTRARIIEAVEDAFHNAGFKMRRVDAVFGGIGGVASIEGAKLVAHLLEVLPCSDRDTKVMAENKVVNAHSGGLAGKPGVCLIASTGAVAYGIDENGNTHQCGGYGYKEGDAGSSYDMGKHCLRIMTRSLDGRIPRTEFSQEILDTLKVQSAADAIVVTDELHQERTRVAALAPIVLKHAELNDSYALNIVEEVTDELVLIIKGVIHHIDLESKQIVLSGSLVNQDCMVRRRLLDKLSVTAPDYDIVKPMLDPVVGAALMALRLSGVDITPEILENAKNSRTPG